MYRLLPSSGPWQVSPPSLLPYLPLQGTADDQRNGSSPVLNLNQDGRMAGLFVSVYSKQRMVFPRLE